MLIAMSVPSGTSSSRSIPPETNTGSPVRRAITAAAASRSRVRGPTTRSSPGPSTGSVSPLSTTIACGGSPATSRGTTFSSEISKRLAMSGRESNSIRTKQTLVIVSPARLNHLLRMSPKIPNRIRFGGGTARTVAVQ